MTSIAMNRPQQEIYSNPGESGDAHTLKRIFRDFFEQLFNNASSVEKSVRLEKVYIESSMPDWDGYGAMAADPSSYHRAKEFLNLLPDNIPVPEFSVDPDGEISLEWFYSKSRLISISVGGDGSLTYIGFLGKVRMKGVDFLDEKIPVTINKLFTRIIR